MHTPTYAVWDTEVTTKSDHGFPASPFYLGNRMVLGGYLLPHGTITLEHDECCFPGPEEAKLVVGANIKFDLLWAARLRGLSPAKLMEGRRVWDVCLAEYLLQRQRVRMPSLEVCAMLNGITETKHPLSADIKSGVCPSTVSPALLRDYHRQDLELTQKVFLSQFALAKERGMLPLIWSQMQALVATCEMEHHGVKINYKALADLRTAYDGESGAILMSIETTLAGSTKTVDFLRDHYREFGGPLIAGSNKFLSILLFGGKFEWATREHVGVYKNGNPKYKMMAKSYTYPRYVDPSVVGAEPTKLGYYTVDEKVLKSIKDDAHHFPSWARELSGLVLEYRRVQKQLSTYVEGVQKHIWVDDRKVHCNFNHNVTLTGRLSCSNPNLQNQTDGDIKRVFVPTSPLGVFIEFDYSQLEVVGLAVLSGCDRLLHDIETGVDIHTALYEDMYGRTPTKVERKAFKPLTFGLIYGAGPRTMAENSGLTVGEAKRFIATFYKRYPGVELYHSDLLSAAKHGRNPTTMKTEKGFPRGQYIHRLFTGREFEFLEYDNDFGGIGTTSFSPTEIKNWPIQGWSTGDVVPLMVGYVVEQITNSEWYGRILPKLTVHDSILFEITDATALDEARNYLVDLMSKTREVILKQFGFDIGIDLKTEHKVGLNWKDMTDA